MLVVTGFEPFSGVPSNPTMRILELLPDELDGIRIEKLILPVDTRAAPGLLERCWRSRPAALVHLGVAANRARLSLEARAENRLRFEVADNQGVRIDDAPIEVDGPPFVTTRLPIVAIGATLSRRGVAWERSESAGTFLCNQVMYQSLRALPPATPTGFIHVPPDEHLAEALGRPCEQPLADQVAGIVTALEWVTTTH